MIVATLTQDVIYRWMRMAGVNETDIEELHRAQCEVREVARMTPAQRELYLDGVAHYRGETVAQELRVRVGEILRESGGENRF